MTGYHEKVAARVLSLTPPLQMHRLFKENGENCQISFIKSLGRWLISSKNVTLVLKNLEELENYPDKVRYIWPRIIAKEWLTRYADKSTNEFIEFLSQHTLIAEYCGNPNY